MGGGASSGSTVVQEGETVVINRSSINALNKLVNTTAVNTMMENVKQCSAAVLNNQNLRIKKLYIGDNGVVTIEQLQQAGLDMSCAQRENIQNSIMTSMVDTIMAQLQSTANQDVVSKLNALTTAKSEQEWGALPWGGATSDSGVSQKIKTHVENTRHTSIQNVIENAVYANFTNSNYSSCINSIVQQQSIELEDVQTGVNVKFTINQSQAANLAAKCIQETDVTNRAINDVVRNVGLKIKEDTSQSSSTDVTGEAKSSALAGGFPALSSSVCFIIVLIIALIAGYFLLQSRGLFGSNQNTPGAEPGTWMSPGSQYINPNTGQPY
jgi:hypothetical protein